MPKSGRKPFTTNLDETLLQRLKIAAILEKCDANDIIEKALIRYLDASPHLPLTVTPPRKK